MKDLQDQHDYSVVCYQNRIKAAQYIDQINSAKKSIPNLSKESEQQLTSFVGTVSRRRSGNNKDVSFGSLLGGFDAVMHTMQEADLPPTEQAVKASIKLNADFKTLEQKWLLFQKTISNK